MPQVGFRGGVGGLGRGLGRPPNPDAGTGLHQTMPWSARARGDARLDAVGEVSRPQAAAEEARHAVLGQHLPGIIS